MNRISLFSFVCMICCNIYAQQITRTIDGIRYVLENGYAQVARQDKSLSGDIVIPQSVTYEGNSYIVNSIIYPTNTTSYGGHTSISAEGGAFQGSSITSITIPSTITTLSSCAFINCSSLKKVVLPSTLRSIDFGCFAYCRSLEQIDIPDNTSTISEWAFGGCSSLRSIVLPSKMTTLSRAVFYQSGLESIEIPNTINWMFEGCLETNTLKHVKMYARDITKVSYTESCFGDVSDTELLVPIDSKVFYQEYFPWRKFKSITEFDDGHSGEPITPSSSIITFEGLRYKISDNGKAEVAQQDNSILTGDIVIPESITIGGVNYTVSGIVNPTNTTSYGGYTSISAEGGAFQGSSITSITIPSTITTLSSCAFINCSSLKKVVLPSTLRSIDFGCFAYCRSLEQIDIPDNTSTISEWAFGGCSSLRSIVLPSKMTTLSRAVFYQSGLESIEIPNTINWMFEGCLETNTLKHVKMYARDITKVSYTESCFGDVSDTELLVPIHSKQQYQEYYPWMNFKALAEFGYSVTLSASEGGYVSSSHDVVLYDGEQLEIKVIPQAGYKLASLIINDINVTEDVLDGIYTLSSVDKNIIVQATFSIESSINEVTIDYTPIHKTMYNLNGTFCKYPQKGHIYIIKKQKRMFR